MSESFNETIRQKCLDQILSSLNTAEVFSQPFPHFFVRNLLPTDIYESLLDALPDTSHYVPLQKYDRSESSTRHRMSLSSKSLSRLDPSSADLVLGIRNALGDPTVKRLVYRKLEEGIAFRFGISKAEVEEAPGYPLPEFYRETSGYSIKPHPDTRRKVVTMQISLARDESQADLGTSFYRLSMKPSALLNEPRGFEKVKQAPFAPNTAYAFVVLNTITKRSWHGREQLPEGCGTRNSLLHLYYGDPSDADQELVNRFYSQRVAA